MHNPDDSSNALTVYGVPRRYDLVALLVMSVAFALLFSLLRSLGASPAVTAVVLTYIAVVGFAQAILFGGRAPRRASLAVGTLFGPTMIGLEAYFTGYPVRVADLLLSAFFFSPVGYLTGAIIGGVFLVSDHLRTFIKNR